MPAEKKSRARSTSARRLKAKPPRKNGNPNRRQKGQPNPDRPCECGCGGKLPSFDETGRPRRFLPNHASAALARGHLTVPDEVMAQLLAGLKRPQEIADALGRNVNVVSIALTKLRAAGKADAVSRGVWEPVVAGAARAS